MASVANRLGGANQQLASWQPAAGTCSAVWVNPPTDVGRDVLSVNNVHSVQCPPGIPEVCLKEAMTCELSSFGVFICLPL